LAINRKVILYKERTPFPLVANFFYP